MPELPEVETIRLGLEKHLVGHTIENIEIRLPKIFQGKPDDIIGGKVTGVRRFGKGLVIDLDNGFSLAIHIKLTGQLVYEDRTHKPPEKIKVIKWTYSTLPNQWTHVIFKLRAKGKEQRDGAFLFYNDFRQFGWIKVVKSDALTEIDFFKDLGPEFFKDLTEKIFIEILEKSNTAVKVTIMDQKKMSGVGNIYANDSLNLSKINPAKKASTLTKDESKRLFHALETVFKAGLKYGGASELSFINALGQEGEYQKHFIAYGQTGKPCKNCGTKLERVMIGGRGTFFCPKCQS